MKIRRNEKPVFPANVNERYRLTVSSNMATSGYSAPGITVEEIAVEAGIAGSGENGTNIDDFTPGGGF